MAVSAATRWNVRPADGSDDNGGGFVTGASGTDYSLQASPQYPLTGETSAGAGNTILSTSAAADMVGNIARAVSGTNINVGYYEVLSVSVGVSITFGTNISGGSICSGIAASAVINIGGGLASVATAWGQIVGGNTILLKGTYTTTSALLLNNASNVGIAFIGYGTTPGDKVHAAWTTSTDSIDLVTQANVGNYYFGFIDFSTTAATPGKGIACNNAGAANALVVESCVLDGFDRAFWGPFATQYYWDILTLSDVEIKNSVNEGIVNVAGIRMSAGCSIHDNGSDGVKGGNGHGVQQGIVAKNCKFWANGGNGVSTDDASMFFEGCVFVDNVSAGLLNNTGAANINGVWNNNICYNNGIYGISLSASGAAGGPGAIANRANAYGANGTAPRLRLAAGIDDVTLSADPFTDRTTGDFSLNGTAGGGADCKGTGFQG